MVDVGKTIAPRSDITNADDLISGPRTITVTGVKGVSGDQPIAISYDGDNGKPWCPCLSMRRVLVKVWGVNGEDYVGQSMIIYNDPNVKFGGVNVGGIRIKAMTGLNGRLEMNLTVSRSKRKPYVVEPLNISPPELTQAQKELIAAGLSQATEGGMENYEPFFTNLSQADKLFLVNNGHHAKFKALAAKPAPNDDFPGDTPTPTQGG